VNKDPAEIVATLRRSIEASQRGSRRLRAHRFRDLFGFQAWSPARREMVGRLLSDEGIAVQPALEQAGHDDWLMFSMPELGVTTGGPPEPQPTAKWFAHLAELPPGGPSARWRYISCRRYSSSWATGRSKRPPGSGSSCGRAFGSTMPRPTCCTSPGTCTTSTRATPGAGGVQGGG
jgi:hypothetical protein